jgi:uncharacterized protein with FMN-binding domain
MYESPKTFQQRIPAAILLLVLTLIIIGTITISRMNSNKVSTNTGQSSTSGPSNNPMISMMYKDGDYTAMGQYTSPGGLESLTVNLTIAANTVTAATVEKGAQDPTASSYQAIFISDYVVGKKVNSISLHNVAGSSLTPTGFMQALKKIEQDAQA